MSDLVFLSFLLFPFLGWSTHACALQTPHPPGQTLLTFDFNNFPVCHVAVYRAQVEKSTSNQNLLQVRTYDCFITYDKHYQTPRFWLLGYDENKTPLTPEQVFQDVPSDHAFKTLTMETFPHSGQLLASVHPCKHASVMKKFIDRMDAAARVRDGSPEVEDHPGAGTGGGEGKKKKWGLGGMVRRVTGGNVSHAAQATKKQDSQSESEEEPQGIQVDFYLVIVSI